MDKLFQNIEYENRNNENRRTSKDENKSYNMEAMEDTEKKN